MNWKLFLRRRQYFINKPFQFRFITLFLVGELALSAIFVSVGLKLKTEVCRITAARILYQTLKVPNLMNQNYSAGYDKILLLGFILVVLLTILFTLFIIIYSHSIAGPVFSLQRHLKRIEEKDYGKMTLRRTDSFKPIATHINQLIDSLKRDQETDLEQLHKALSEMDTAPEAAKQTLSDLVTHKERILEPATPPRPEPG